MKKLSLFVCSALLSVNVSAEQSRTGRYTTVEVLPEQYQLDPFSGKTSIRFPSSISSIDKALKVLIAPTGYEMTEHLPPTVKSMLARSLPVTHRSFSKLSRRAIIQTLLPDSLVFVTDSHNRLVGFDLHPDYVDYVQPVRGDNEPVQLAMVNEASEPDKVQIEFSEPVKHPVPLDESDSSKHATHKNINKSTSNISADVPVSDKPSAVAVEPKPVFVRSGWLRENVARLSKQFNVIVVWDDKIPTCFDWQIRADYQLPHTELQDVFAYLFDQYPLIPRFSTRDRVLEILPLKEFMECSDD